MHRAIQQLDHLWDPSGAQWHVREVLCPIEKPHFSAGLFNTRDGPAKASGSEMAHSLLTSGFLMRVLEDVEGGT